MPSQSRQDLDTRLADIEQLFQAHSALTKFKKAEAAANEAGGGLSSITKVVDALVTTPGKGKPAEVGALNRSAFVLLCAHFQGFIEDLHKEAANHSLAGRVTSIEDTVKLVKPRNSNPHADIIERMFSGIGIFDLMAAAAWQKCSNATVRKRLTEYISERNKIAHGNKPIVRKAKVQAFMKFAVKLADILDEEVARQIEVIKGTKPW